MADAKITELTALTAPIGADLLPIVDDVAGTPVTKKITVTTLMDTFNSDSLASQCLINSNFVVNQRAYGSSNVLASGSYGHDRWKAGASGGDYTFTQLDSSTQITIEAGKTLIQVIEDKNVIGGTYTLSWTGTAQGRYAVDSATPAGAYADSPIAITGQTAGTVMSIEFDDGTLGKVVLNSGTSTLPFMAKSYENELTSCQRYYEIIKSESAGAYIGLTNGINTSTTRHDGIYTFKVSKRVASYTLKTSGVASDYAVIHGTNTVTACSAVPAFVSGVYNTLDNCMVKFTVASGLTAGNASMGRGNNSADTYLAFDAEL